MRSLASALANAVRRIVPLPSRRRPVEPDLPASNPDAPLRFLVLANAMLPTLQLALVHPMRALVESGEVGIDFLTEEQLKQRFGKDTRSPEAAAWFHRRLAESRATCLFVCRYSGPFARDAIAFARDHAVPSIYCIDDDLLNVPREIGQAKFEYHNHPLRLEAVRACLEGADLVYCSNARLAARLEQLGIQRAPYVGKLFCAGTVIAPPREGPALTMGYMGFDHAHDFEVALPAVVRALRHNPGLKFELFGRIARPPQLQEFGERVVQLPVVADYEGFLRALADRAWDIGICPLARTAFNQVKNVNKWIEYTSVGTAVVATRGMIYDECCADGCGWLANDGDWDEALQTLIDDDELRVQQVRRAQRRLDEEYSLDRLREQVLDAVAEAGRRHSAVAA
jgi:glycosyltransferase involved in cell wall biosynthesis